MSENSNLQWGPEDVVLQFANHQYIFSGLTIRQKDTITERFPCIQNPLRHEITVQTAIGYDEIPPQDIDQFSVNNFYTPVIQYQAEGLTIEGYGFTAEINLCCHTQCNLLARDEQEIVRSFIFENYLRILAAYTSLHHGGLFLHSAGIVINNKSYLFIGRSGAGKTTLSRLALESGYTILSDDANIVLPGKNGDFQAGSVPFAGELGQVNTNFMQTCPVAGIFWLEQSLNPASTPLTPALQIAKMLACCPMVNVDPFRLNQVLTTIETLLDSVPLRVLHFKRDQPFTAIRHLIEREYND